MTILRPRVAVFAPEQVEAVVADAIRGLETVGFFVENRPALDLLRQAGISLDGQRAFPSEGQVRTALATAPSRILVHDRDGKPALDLGGDTVHFDPGSAALHVLDPVTRRRRPPLTADLAHLAWISESCRHIAGASTALVPSDVPEVLGDRWRLLVALLHGRKPIATGTFQKDGFAVMHRLLATVRGSEAALREQPLAVFDCCPTPPLKWSDLTCQALLDCARTGVPAELVSMPLGGVTSPVTVREMIVQHCAESLSGVLIHQLAAPGSPIIWGGSPAAVDMRHGTTPMGAVETMLVDVGNAQVGQLLRLPTHAYMGMSDAKGLDFQCGLESGFGALLGALAGINLIAGPGMLDFETTQSLEKLLLDNEVCGMALRAVQGVSERSAGEAVDLIRQVVEQGSFLAHPTRELTTGRSCSFRGASSTVAPAATGRRPAAPTPGPPPRPRCSASSAGATPRPPTRRCSVSSWPS